MAQNLPKAYEPAEVEKYWSKYWEENKTFTPDPANPGGAFSIVIPPPNVTGALHIGHALNLSLIDLLCRHARQLGKNVLWIPGTDHAGISTQHVVEKKLLEEGQTRTGLGREEFLKRVWRWRDEYGGKILDQIAAIGCSVDWTRLRFTMDEGMSRTVRKVFVALYNEGLIYRGNYIVNWCPRCHTALADDEVERETEQGRLWKIRYDVEGNDEGVIIATTRPETIPGDTAVCVHPDDDRYRHLVGKQAIVPGIGRKIPIIADSYVEMDFGTGCLKVTPCHDHNDWQLGKKHNLEFIQVVDDCNRMTQEAGAYAGMTLGDCRAAILKDLDKEGRMLGEEKIEHGIGCCYRCHTVVEPYVSRQWFVAATKLAKPARDAVPDQTKLLPQSWLKTYYHWLDNIHDWCISRQIWWGHRIPAWTCAQCGKLTVAEEDPKACPVCGSIELVQEEDVLDTWFSSALWPFSTLGWPEITEDLKRWYPTSILVTGFDILFFWVARMMMMGIHFMGTPPFASIYLHALVRDAQGQKMSKSKGNGIDPLEMIQKYGCDALRFTLVQSAAMGRDIRLSEVKIEASRHFVNKLWNSARFALLNLPDIAPAKVDLQNLQKLYQTWILDRLESVKLEMDQSLTDCRFNDAAMCGYKFLWNDFCDWFLELSKADLQSDDEEVKTQVQYVLWLTLKEIVLLLHPIIPFVTAEIWRALPVPQGEEKTDIALESYPPYRPECIHPAESSEMEFIQNIIIAVRTIKAELGINPGKKIDLVLHPVNDRQQKILEHNQNYIWNLGKLEKLDIDAAFPAPKASAVQVVEGCQVIVPLAGAVNLEDELARLDKELAKLDKELIEVQKKLHNESFISRAPAEVVARERERADRLIDARNKLAEKKKVFDGASEDAAG